MRGDIGQYAMQNEGQEHNKTGGFIPSFLNIHTLDY